VIPDNFAMQLHRPWERQRLPRKTPPQIQVIHLIRCV